MGDYSEEGPNWLVNINVIYSTLREQERHTGMYSCERSPNVSASVCLPDINIIHIIQRWQRHRPPR